MSGSVQHKSGDGQYNSGNVTTGSGVAIVASRIVANRIVIGSVEVSVHLLRFAFFALEVLELLLSIIILGITISAALGMKHDLEFESVPGKLIYNIVIAAFSMVHLFIVILLDAKEYSWLGYHVDRISWPRVALNGLFCIFWIASIPTSFYTCGDLCSAAGGFATLDFATFQCQCPSPDSQFGYRSLLPRTWTYEQRTGRYEATEALDILLAIFFILSTTLLCVPYWAKKKQVDVPLEPREQGF